MVPNEAKGEKRKENQETTARPTDQRKKRINETKKEKGERNQKFIRKRLDREITTQQMKIQKEKKNHPILTI